MDWEIELNHVEMGYTTFGFKNLACENKQRSICYIDMDIFLHWLFKPQSFLTTNCYLQFIPEP